MKILILGYARHGKDTFAEILCEEFADLKFYSASKIANEEYVFNKLKEKYNYLSLNECYDDRINHRKEWYELIKEYLKEDKSRLSKKVLEKSDICVGIRDIDEFNASKSLFDIIIWVDASERLLPESIESCTVTKSCADIIIENNGTLQDLFEKTIKLGFCFKFNQRF